MMKNHNYTTERRDDIYLYRYYTLCIRIYLLCGGGGKHDTLIVSIYIIYGQQPPPFLNTLMPLLGFTTRAYVCKTQNIRRHPYPKFWRHNSTFERDGRAYQKIKSTPSCTLYTWIIIGIRRRQHYLTEGRDGTISQYGDKIVSPPKSVQNPYDYYWQ